VGIYIVDYIPGIVPRWVDIMDYIPGIVPRWVDIMDYIPGIVPRWVDIMDLMIRWINDNPGFYSNQLNHDQA